MAKFTYHLQNILEIKYKLEEQAKTVYGNAVMKLKEEETKLEFLKKKQSSYEESLRACILNTLRIEKIKWYENAIETIKYNEKVQAIVVRNAELQAEKARNQLNEAMVERKTHEKLKDNAFEQFKKDLDKEERKEIDELVSFKFNKHTRSEDD